MTRLRGVLLSLLCGFLVSCTTANLGTGRQADIFAPGEVIALIPAGQFPQAIKSRASRVGFALQEEVRLPGLRLRMLRYTYPEAFTGQTAIAALEAADPTATAGVNHLYTLGAAAGASRFDYAGGLMRWPTGGCRARIAIGLIDTLVDPQRIPGGRARLVTKDFTRGTAKTTQHGTDVAFILSDPNVISGGRIYNAGAIGAMQSGRPASGVDGLIKSLDWLAAQNVRVVNMSLAGPYNKLLDRSVRTAIANGMTIVAAAGNDGATAAPRYPAAFDGVIAVTAVDARQAVFRQAVRGKHIDIAAPGVDIPVPDGETIRFVSGTSIAAPFVTARIASDPVLAQKSPEQVVASISKSAVDLGASGPDPIFGAGLIQAPPRCGR
jgi:hypothetical protein